MLRKIEKSIFLTKPIIGIVGRKDNEIIKVNNSIVKAIIKCGGNPILILPSNRLKDILKICDGIVMPGGTDIYDYDKYICNYAIENDYFYKRIIDKNYQQYWYIVQKQIFGISDQLKNLYVRMVSYSPEEKPSVDQILNDE